MTITLRAIKGSALTWPELDANFTTLQALQAGKTIHGWSFPLPNPFDPSSLNSPYVISAPVNLGWTQIGPLVTLNVGASPTAVEFVNAPSSTLSKSLVSCYNQDTSVVLSTFAYRIRQTAPSSVVVYNAKIQHNIYSFSGNDLSSYNVIVPTQQQMLELQLEPLSKGYWNDLASAAIVAGTRYRIVTAGSNFVSIGADNNNVGTTFTATGAVSGSGTVNPVVPGVTQTNSATYALEVNLVGNVDWASKIYDYHMMFAY
jgi:hypothetical protein